MLETSLRTFIDSGTRKAIDIVYDLTCTSEVVGPFSDIVCEHYMLEPGGETPSDEAFLILRPSTVGSDLCERSFSYRSIRGNIIFLRLIVPICVYPATWYSGP